MRTFLAVPVVAVGLTAAVALAGCGSSGRASAPADGRPHVIAAFYPIFEAAQRVGGDAVRVTNLTPAGSEPHDLELTSRQVDRIEDAAVVLLLGRGFQPAVQKAAARAKGVTVDLLGEVGTLLPTPPGEEPALEVDPHVWLDPSLLKAMAGRISGAFGQADPTNRATYAANAAAYGRELDGLDATFRQGLSRCDRKVIVTSHAAFGYLARRYGLTQEPISGLSPESEPNPRRLAELATKVRSQGTTTIFYETLVSPKVAQSLAREAGVTAAVLDPLEGLSSKDAAQGKTYASVMGDNLVALRQALGCG